MPWPGALLGRILAWSRRFPPFMNQWAADHTQVLADGEPILALDKSTPITRTSAPTPPAMLTPIMRNPCTGVGYPRATKGTGAPITDAGHRRSG